SRAGDRSRETQGSGLRRRKELVRVLRRAVANGHLAEPFTVFVAIRPGRRSRVWNTSAFLQQHLEAIQPPSIDGRPIAFALRSRDLTQSSVPAEWVRAAGEITAATQQPGATVDEILERVWPA